MTGGQGLDGEEGFEPGQGLAHHHRQRAQGAAPCGSTQLAAPSTSLLACDLGSHFCALCCSVCVVRVQSIKAKAEPTEADLDASVKLYYAAFKAGAKPAQLKL